MPALAIAIIRRLITVILPPSFLNFYDPNSKLRGGTPKADETDKKQYSLLTGICANAGEAAGPGNGKDGMACSIDDDCQSGPGTSGTCARKTKQQNLSAGPGFVWNLTSPRLLTATLISTPA